MDAKERKRLEAAGYWVGDAEDFLGLTEEERNIVELRVAAPSPEMLDLARRAVDSCRSRQGEDVQVWAERLAKDVGLAGD